MKMKWIDIILLLIVFPNVHPLSSSVPSLSNMLYKKSRLHGITNLCVMAYSMSQSSIQGSDPNRPQKVNQDASFDFAFEDRCYMWGILDGHGIQGHVLTSYLAQQLPLRLQKELFPLLSFIQEDPHRDNDQSWDEYNNMVASIIGSSSNDSSKSELETAFVRAFHRVQLDAMQNPNVPSARNGATCIVAAMLPNQETCNSNNKSTLEENDMNQSNHHHSPSESSSLWLAHVGDSRALLVSRDGTFQVLTTETTTRTISTELERIQRCEGRIDANGNVWYGPQGIAMTRSLGNSVMLRAGIIPTPILERNVSWKSDDLLILATDGVWEVMSNEDVVTLLRGNGNDDNPANNTAVSNSAERIAEEARKRWIGDLPFVDEAKVDDITCMIIEL
jgi:serine/threonine protein phosphatase PrpC